MSVQIVSDLNKLWVPRRYYPDQPLTDFSCSTMDAGVTVLFRNIESELILQIRYADYVVGCVAWLTSEPIIQELSKKKNVSIIVQKEDFLRPDANVNSNWSHRLRELYSSLPEFHFYRFTNLCALYYDGIGNDSTIEAVRCLGNHNQTKSPSWPRSHHKFVVFGTANDYRHPCHKFHSVWTGSFNFTKNATQSLENAVIIHNDWVARAYYKEWEQLLVISEPLDWETPWCNPQFCVGT